MKTLADLKERLEALPARQRSRDHEGRFVEYLAKCAPAKEKMIKAIAAIAVAAPVLPSGDYRVARKSVNSGAGIASRLAEKLKEDPALISEPKTEESFVRLIENADAALKKCQSVWMTELHGKIESRQVIAEVVAKLGEGDSSKSLKVPARRLKATIDSLVAAQSKLPLTKKEAAEVSENLKDMADSVSKLGLDTPFGKFLQAAASEQGAALSDAQAEVVFKQIESLNLAKVFRVHLTS
jgi:hypothetical protein